jgi:hypothetical protein
VGDVDATASLAGTFQFKSQADPTAAGVSAFNLVVGGTGSDRNLQGTASSDWISLDAGDDRIDAGFGFDSVLGGSGNDTLNGGSGRDTLVGGSGADRFRFDADLSAATNIDTITDFSATAGDRLVLDRAIFTTLNGGGSLSGSAFRAGAGLVSATTATDRILYDTSSGALRYDADGSGSDAGSGYARNDRDKSEREERDNTSNPSKPSAKNERTRVNTPVTVSSLTAMKALHNNQDTSTLTLAELSREKPESGYYVVAGMNKSEIQVDNLIKGYYMMGIRSYKFFNPKNGYYYVYLTRRSSKSEADQIKFEGVQGVDNLWTTEVQ